MSKRERPHRVNVASNDPRRIRDEIASIEARLGEMGYDGDCAYEKAMIRFFEQQVALRRDWLKAG